VTDTQWVMEGGELVAYADPFKNVTEGDVDAAEQLEQFILAQAGAISKGYLMIGRALSEFKSKKCYLARGFDSFQAWADSPNLMGIGYRTAQDLIRIYEDVLPILAEHDAMDVLPFVQSSKMRAILPMLGDEDAEEKIIDAVYKIKDLTTKDAFAVINEIRGKNDPFDDKMPTVFTAKVMYGESFHKVIITASNNDDVYTVGTIHIKPRDWPRWEDRFGRFIQIV